MTKGNDERKKASTAGADRDKVKGTAEKRPVKKLSNDFYLKELARLHVELVELQEWIKARGMKVVVIFERRDAAGKGGVIKRISEPLNPANLPGGGAARHPPNVSGTSGISSATSHICRPPARWFCSTAAGTTGRESSG